MRLGGTFDYTEKSERLVEVKRELESSEVWSEPERAQALGKERALLEKIVEGLDRLTNGADDCYELLQMAEEESSDGEIDEETVAEVVTDLEALTAEVTELEFQRMFSGKQDASDAFIDIQSGSGGTEAQDWAEMLLRMYLRLGRSSRLWGGVNRGLCWRGSWH